jgi:environmental stress-induced protein Ves
VNTKRYSSGRMKMKNGVPLNGTPYRIITKDKVKKRSWSGGTVNQLFIYPENADFDNKDFIFQVSTATVDVEESLFTFFDNYDRIIMTTDNEFVLVHNDKEEIFLAKNEPHIFYGGDKTQGKGKVNDFNLIMKRGVCRGDVMSLSMAAGSVVFPRKGNDKCARTLEIVYCAHGRLTLRSGKNQEHLEQGDVLVIDHGEMNNKYLLSNEEDQVCEIVMTKVMIGPFKE